MLMLKILGFLATGAATTCGAPLACIHLKLISPPHFHEHELTTDVGSTITQKSFFSVGRRNYEFGDRLPGLFRISRVINPQNAEALWPVGVFVPPLDRNDLSSSSQEVQSNFSGFLNGLDYHDPLLLTGRAAMIAVQYLYGRGELFFHQIPHVRALLRNQEERKFNGLPEHSLKSLRPSSPFYGGGGH